MLNGAGNRVLPCWGGFAEMQRLRQSYLQCWGTHPVADLGRKEILCNRKIRRR